MAEGRIVLATDPNTTLQNAAESTRWLADHPDIRRVLRITSRSHMPRASLALERALKSSSIVVEVVRYPVEDGRSSGSDSGGFFGSPRFVEWVKFGGTWVSVFKAPVTGDRWGWE